MWQQLFNRRALRVTRAEVALRFPEKVQVE